VTNERSSARNGAASYSPSRVRRPLVAAQVTDAYAFAFAVQVSVPVWHSLFPWMAGDKKMSIWNVPVAVVGLVNVPRNETENV